MVHLFSAASTLEATCPGPAVIMFINTTCCVPYEPCVAPELEGNGDNNSSTTSVATTEEPVAGGATRNGVSVLVSIILIIKALASVI